MTGLVVIWIVCGILGYGFTFSMFQKKFPEAAKDNYWSDFWFSVLMGMSGPLSLITLFPDDYKYGLKFW